MNFAARGRFEIPGQRGVVPGLCLSRFSHEREKIAERLLELGPRRAPDDFSVKRDGLVELALGPEQLGPVLVRQPITGVGFVALIVMGRRFLITPAVELQQPSLQLHPSVGAHLFGGDFIFGLTVEFVGELDIAEFRFPIGEAREIVPGRVFLDGEAISFFRLFVSALLKGDARF